MKKFQDIDRIKKENATLTAVNHQLRQRIAAVDFTALEKKQLLLDQTIAQYKCLLIEMKKQMQKMLDTSRQQQKEHKQVKKQTAASLEKINQALNRL